MRQTPLGTACPAAAHGLLLPREQPALPSAAGDPAVTGDGRVLEDSLPHGGSFCFPSESGGGFELVTPR